MIGCNEVMVMNVDQCKLCYHMLCVHDVMQVICYVFMMLCKLCKWYAMCSWCYASYASHMLCDHDVMQVMQVFMMLVAMINIDPLWHHDYASWVYDDMQVHVWYVCKFGVWLYAISHMTCYAIMVFDYMQVTCASLHLSMICIHMQVNPFVCHTYICKFTPLYDISNLCKLFSLWHMWFVQVWVDYLC